jgi:colicin import membrane protein
MNTINYYEVHKFSAGALALVVHAVFLSLLYFSFNWHVKMPPNMIVEMWDKLPEPASEIPPEIPPLPIPVFQKTEIISIPKVVEPVLKEKADIVFKDKKKKKTEPAKKTEPIVNKPSIQDDKARQKAVDDQLALAQAVLEKKARQEELNKQIADIEKSARESERIQARRAKMRSELSEATNSEVAKFKDLIQAKISRNIIMPPDVADNAEAIFLITVLPDGSVMDNVKLEKSSGNAAYDNAAERAIYKAQPLPMPQNAELSRMFRELRLSVKP